MPGIMHWVSALIIALLLLVGLFLFEGKMSDYPAKAGFMMVHMAGGSLLAVLTVFRIAWRAFRARFARSERDFSDQSRGWFQSLPWLLYAILLGVIATGFATAVLSGLNLAIFGGDQAALVPNWPDMTILSIHGWLARSLFFIATAHGMIAIGRLRRSRDDGV